MTKRGLIEMATTKGRTESPIPEAMDPWNTAALCALAAAVIVAILLRVQFLDLPLDRDEGEFAYGGQTILAGEAPYESLYAMKLPGIYLSYAIFEALFGHTQSAIHGGLLLVNLASIAMVYLLGRRLMNAAVGALAAAAFAILSLNEAVDGLSALAEHFVVLPVLIGAWLTVDGVKRNLRGKLIAAGVFLGLAVMMKQHGVILSVSVIAFAAIQSWSAADGGLRRAVISTLCMMSGALLPLAATVAWMSLHGALEPFVFWTWTYPREYTQLVPWKDGWDLLWTALSRQWKSPALAIWLAAAIGAVSLLFGRTNRQRALFLGLFALGSAAAVCPGMYFRTHYFLLAGPGLALLAAVGIDAVYRALTARAASDAFATSTAWCLAAVAIGWPVIQSAVTLMPLTSYELSRRMYGLNPFPESVPVAQYLAEHSEPGDQIGILGSEPQLLFYAQRRSATSHIYMYPLMENQPFAERMQREVISDLESHPPKFLVLVNHLQSWLPHQGRPELINPWIGGFTQDHYTLVGVVDTLNGRDTNYVWDSDAASYQPRSARWMAIYQRRD